jgi:hypothetical protein
MLTNFRWWLIACCIASVSGYCFELGLFHKLWAMDATHLELPMVVAFYIISLFIGYLTFKAFKGELTAVTPHREALDYSVEFLFYCGLAGSLVGIIGVFQDMRQLSQAVDLSTSAGISQLINSVVTNLSTALITTLVGTITGQLIKLQLVNLNYLMPEDER